MRFETKKGKKAKISITSVADIIYKSCFMCNPRTMYLQTNFSEITVFTLLYLAQINSNELINKMKKLNKFIEINSLIFMMKIFN